MKVKTGDIFSDHTIHHLVLETKGDRCRGKNINSGTHWAWMGMNSIASGYKLVYRAIKVKRKATTTLNKLDRFKNL